MNDNGLRTSSVRVGNELRTSSANLSRSVRSATPSLTTPLAHPAQNRGSSCVSLYDQSFIERYPFAVEVQQINTGSNIAHIQQCIAFQLTKGLDDAPCAIQ